MKSLVVLVMMAGVLALVVNFRKVMMTSLPEEGGAQLCKEMDGSLGKVGQGNR